MDEPKCIILYKDHHYRLASRKKIRRMNLADRKIKTILIPCENGKCYFPMKPHYYLNFFKACVMIIHKVFAFDFEEVIGDDIKIDIFETECYDIIDLGNALFNLYKFRGTSLLIAESLDVCNGINVTFTSYPIHISIRFFNRSGDMSGAIDSGKMSSLKDRCNPNDYLSYPPQYQCEDRLQCLEELIYVPMNATYRATESQIDGIPSIINLFDEKHWKKVNYYAKDVSSEDLLLKKIQDFCAYVPIDGSIYDMIDTKNLKHAVVEFICSPLAIDYEKDFLPSLKEHKIPKIREKMECYQAYKSGEIFRPIPCRIEINDPNLYFTVYSFFETIMNYIQYFTQASYGIKNTRYLNFVLFGDWGDNLTSSMMLTEPEFTEEKINNRFAKLIGGK